MNVKVIDILENIPSLKGYSSVEKIDEGYSADNKYIVNVRLNRYLLRLSDKRFKDKRKLEFLLLQDLEKQGVQTNKAIEHIFLEKASLSVMVLSYIDGIPANEVISVLPDETQYEIGIVAGQQLRKIHAVNAPQDFNWEVTQKKKFSYYLSEYRKGSFKLKNEDEIIRFIEGNLSQLKHRPSTLLHDDFHLGHIILHNNAYNGFIDLNGYDFGDPYHDFYNLSLFSRRVSVPYCIGQIKSYFPNNQPDHTFWRLYALYAAMNLFSTIVWTRKYDEHSFDDALERIDLILQDHDYFNFDKPLWYKTV
ncbi:aminoglycoside phosphotransferase family protein [Sutcliffiella halmapala]|uniref:aminoglycoside phosphotransferase family protein n=1 Tax=Sutcliffiella halmapala TaxID=79882 RepID=UPI000995196F|nr:aminoglycoside phosphotransferase family protein [Sutcliffiella halmapala]